MAYATVDEYEARYGYVQDEYMLQECLDDCSAAIDAELERRGIDHTDPTPAYADRLMRVCRSMANRVMPEDGASDVPVGVTTLTATAGPYSRTYNFATTYGTPKMLPSEMALLGIGGGRIGCGLMAGSD